MAEQEPIRQTEKEPEHHCAIVGVYDPDGDPTGVAHILLYHMNNRGQEGSMIAVERSDGTFDKRGGPGWVSQAYTKEDIQILREGHPLTACGQNRYSTSGGLDVFQPFVSGFGSFEVNTVARESPQMLIELVSDKNRYGFAHNGNLTNATRMLDRLPDPAKCLAPNDTGVAFLTLALAQGNWEERIRSMVSRSEGAANFVINADGKIYAYRDPWGFRPLSIGKLPSRGEGTRQGYVVASENAAFSANGITYVRDVLPGEGIVIDESGVRMFYLDERVTMVDLAQCMFELVYFAAPDAVIFGKHVSEIRREIGALLARKDVAKGFLPDRIVPIQHSGIPFAEGYAAEMIRAFVAHPEAFGYDPDDRETVARKAGNLQTETGLVANIYAKGRTFIAPGERAEINTVKHRGDPVVVKGRKVVVIDDSIVRGNTQRVAIRLLREAGALEVHSRNGFPPVRHPCFMGVDFPTSQELIVNNPDGEEGIKKAIQADSLDFVTPRELLEIVIGPSRLRVIDDADDHTVYERGGHCGACIIREQKYRTDVTGVFSKKAC
jgi:amidophosphoribosyltransferase